MQINPIPPLFVDANLVMYALGGPHPLRDPCRIIFEKIKMQEFPIVTNTEVLQEILYRYFSIGRSALGEIAYRSIVGLSLHVFPIKIEDTDRALELLKTYKNITSRDAIHAATLMNNGIKEIISTDLHFDLIPEIKRIDPTDFR